MYNYQNKNSSPKRNLGQSSFNQNTVKKGALSIERKDYGRSGKADSKIKTLSAISGTSNAYL